MVFAGIYVHSDLHSPLADVTLYYTVFFVTSFISRILLSFSSHKRLILPVMLTMGLTVIGMFLMFLSSSADIFALSMAVLGIPHGLSYPLSLFYLSRSYETSERSAANSYFFSLMTIIMVAGPVLGGYSTEVVGWRVTFLFIVPIVSIFMIMVLFSNTQRH
ncbi:major facilitator superfamily MFS_1, partial [mine drainage metagenome]